MASSMKFIVYHSSVICRFLLRLAYYTIGRRENEMVWAAGLVLYE